MANLRLPFLSLLILAATGGPVLTSKAQGIAGVHRQSPKETSYQEATFRSLETVLSELESKYGVSFFYKSKLVENKQVDAKRPSYNTLEEELDYLLPPANLKYEKLRNKVYVLSPRKSGDDSESPRKEKDTRKDGSPQSSTIDSPIEQPGIENFSTISAEFRITGKVTSENGESLPGVSVVLKGTSTGTATDANGNYSLNLPDGNGTLVFSYIGYTKEEIPVNNRTTIDIVLVPDVNSLSEVIVTGYSSQERKDITGSVAIVKAKDLLAVPSSSAEQQLQGRAAGVTVTTSGQPGTANTVRIRGYASFGNNSPLYVIDGVPTFDISTLNPNDIESMNVLKDAGAASIYGSRASNGVIVITTKRGKSGAIKVSYDAYYGTQQPGKGFTNLLNSQGMADLTWAALKNSGQVDSLGNPSSAQYGNDPNPVLPDYILPSGAFAKLPNGQPNPAVDPSLYNINPDKGDIYQIVQANKSGTNWYKELVKSARIQSHNLNVSGGSDNARYFLGLNYFDQQGIVLNTYLRRYTIRANSDFKVRKHIRIGESIQLSYRENPQINNIDEQNDISLTYRSQPIIPVYDIKGGFAGTAGKELGDASNPIANRIRAKDNKSYDNKFFGNVYAEVDFLKNFTLRTSFGGSYENGNSYAYTYQTYENAENNGTNSYTESSYNLTNWTWTNTLKYNKVLGNHSIQALAGVEALKDNGRSLGGSRINYFSDDPAYWSLSTGSSGITNFSTPNTPTTLFSIFGKVDYAFRDKYLLSATIRRDGSSRFGANKRYGVFPSVTAAWRISQEGFIKDISWINDMKIRGGYGTLGNQLNVDPRNQFTLYSGSPGSTAYDITGSGNSTVFGLRRVNIGNPNAAWETNSTANIGLDIALFNNQLEVIADIYQKDTKKLLFNPELPAVLGAPEPPYINIASMRNRGLDLQTIYRKQISSDWKFEANLTFTTYKNTITKLADNVTYFDDGNTTQQVGPFTRNAVGHPISAFYGYQVIGLFQSDEDVQNSPAQDGAGPGRFKYADVNGVDDKGNLTGKPDGKIGPEDRVFFGNPNPKFTYGLNLNVTYRNFDLSMFFYGVQGKDIINYTRWWTDFYASFQGGKSNDALYNSWTPQNPGARTPIAENVSNFSNNGVPNSYYKENGSYLRAKNVQLGYTIPKSMLSKAGIDRLRVYVQTTNLFTITKYTGLDPELSGSDTSFGVDAGNYPLTRQYILGLNVTF